MIRLPRLVSVARCIAAAAFATLVSAPLPAAANNPVTFEGRGFLSYNETCMRDRGWRGPNEIGVFFMPANVGTNGQRERLTLILGQSMAQNYSADPGPFTNRFQPVVSSRTHWDTYFHATQARLRLTRKVPQRINARTPRVVLEGVIANFDDAPGCNATFHIHVVRQPR